MSTEIGNNDDAQSIGDISFMSTEDNNDAQSVGTA